MPFGIGCWSGRRTGLAYKGEHTTLTGVVSNAYGKGLINELTSVFHSVTSVDDITAHGGASESTVYHSQRLF